MSDKNRLRSLEMGLTLSVEPKVSSSCKYLVKDLPVSLTSEGNCTQVYLFGTQLTQDSGLYSSWFPLTLLSYYHTKYRNKFNFCRKIISSNFKSYALKKYIISNIVW